MVVLTVFILYSLFSEFIFLNHLFVANSEQGAGETGLKTMNGEAIDKLKNNLSCSRFP